jgi:hypothetical protein
MNPRNAIAWPKDRYRQDIVTDDLSVFIKTPDGHFVVRPSEAFVQAMHPASHDYYRQPTVSAMPTDMALAHGWQA